MLVPRQHLARASGLSQLGQALEMIVSPVLAGLLFVAIGLRGIIFIDFITFFFAIGALLLVAIPRPPAPAEPPAAGPARPRFWRDAAYGWHYLRARPGLFGLLWYFALANFLTNFAAVLVGPLVLARHSAAALGPVQMAAGLGMLAGSVLMSAWGGPRRRVPAIIGFIGLGAVGLFIVGLHPSAVFPAAGLFLLLFAVPLASGPSQALFQIKVPPAVHGRVFAMRSAIARSMMPLAFLLAGPLADRVAEPLLRPGGALAASLAGQLLGVGPGRGIGLLFVLAALVLLAASLGAYAAPRIRCLEAELPDALADSLAEPPAAALAVQSAS
jgi:hypothetical protein